MESSTAPRVGSRSRYKSFISLFRNSFRVKNTQKEPAIATSRKMVSPPLPILGLDHVNLDICNGGASTSRGPMWPLVKETIPAVYEDPFVAVSVDGTIHVRNYYTYKSNVEYATNTSLRSLPEEKSTRHLKTSRLTHIYFSRNDQLSRTQLPKSWGMARNGVWWASHLHRESLENNLYSVVLDDNSAIKCGFSIASLTSFIESLRQLGLSPKCVIESVLPQLPLNSIQLPFIDEDIEEG